VDEAELMGVQDVLAAEVRARMEELTIRQRDLAMVVGISEKHLSQMLTGRSQGSLAMWDKLLEALEA
jgi:transcriptional regulator with XRE-family HTH domain